MMRSNAGHTPGVGCRGRSPSSSCLAEGCEWVCFSRKRTEGVGATFAVELSLPILETHNLA